MLENAKEILIFTLLIFHFVFMIYASYSVYISFKEEKKFWKKQIEITDTFLEQIRNTSIINPSIKGEDINANKE